MAQIIIHNNLSVDEVNEQRLFYDFKLSHNERLKRAFQLMKLSILFSQKDKSVFKKEKITKQ